MDRETLFKLHTAVIEAKTALREAIAAAAGQTVKDYPLVAADGSPTTLSALFGDKDDLLLIHNMGQSCNYCALWADGFRGLAEHITERAAFALASPDAPADLSAQAKARGWNYPIVSVKDSPLAADLGYYEEGKGYMPGVSGFHKASDGTITRTGNTFFGPGDDFCAVWPLFDLLKDGAKGWEPRATAQAVCCAGKGCGCS